MATYYNYLVKQYDDFEDKNDFYLVNKTCPNPIVYITKGDGTSPELPENCFVGCGVQLRIPEINDDPETGCRVDAMIESSVIVANGPDWLQIQVIESGCDNVTTDMYFIPAREANVHEPTEQMFRIESSCEQLDSMFDLTGCVGTYYRCIERVYIDYDPDIADHWECLSGGMDTILNDPEHTGYEVYEIAIASYDPDSRVATLVDPLPFVPYTDGSDIIKLTMFLHWPSYPLYVTCSDPATDPGDGGDTPEDPGWEECCINFKDGIERSYDLANEKIQGRQASKTVQYSLVQKDYRAKSIADRELKKAAYPLADVSLKVNRAAFKLQPGDPFNLSVPEYGITRMVVRVGRIIEEGPDSEIITVICIEDVNYIKYYQGTV